MKSERVELRASASELRLWDAAAAEVGLTRGAWLRLLANQATSLRGVRERIKKAAQLAKQTEGLVDPALVWGMMLAAPPKRRKKR